MPKDVKKDGGTAGVTKDAQKDPTPRVFTHQVLRAFRGPRRYHAGELVDLTEARPASVAHLVTAGYLVPLPGADVPKAVVSRCVARLEALDREEADMREELKRLETNRDRLRAELRGLEDAAARLASVGAQLTDAERAITDTHHALEVHVPKRRTELGARIDQARRILEQLGEGGTS